MCGRYTLTESPEDIAEAFSDAIHFSSAGVRELASSWQPRFNIAPTQYSLVAADIDAISSLRTMRWGLVPHWAKDEKISAKLINARAETVAEKPSFRDGFKKRRCLVFADGYYEWTTHEGAKRPIYIKPKTEKVIAFAGIWASWNRPDSEPLQSYSIITTSANTDLDKAHHRMPVVLPRDSLQAWISPQTPQEEILQLLRPSPGGTFAYHFVSNYVNSPRNEGMQCIQADQAPTAY